jgi:hypothetical protein
LAIVAEHLGSWGLGLVDAWRLMLVCAEANAGAKEFLGNFIGLIKSSLLAGL